MAHIEYNHNINTTKISKYKAIKIILLANQKKQKKPPNKNQFEYSYSNNIHTAKTHTY